MSREPRVPSREELVEENRRLHLTLTEMRRRWDRHETIADTQRTLMKRITEEHAQALEIIRMQREQLHRLKHEAPAGHPAAAGGAGARADRQDSFPVGDIRRFLNGLDSVSLILLDAQMRIMWHNEASERILGLEADCSGRTCREVTARPAELCESCLVRRALETGAMQEGHLRLEDERHLWRRASPVYAGPDSEHPEGVVCLSLDVTGQKRMELELEEARESARRATEFRSQFITNIGHELRTPLNGMLGMLQLLDTSALRRGQAEFVRGAIESTRRLSAIVDDILDLSQAYQGYLCLCEHRFTPAELAADLEALFLPAAQERGTAIRVRGCDRADQPLKADVRRFSQVLTNLVGNAVKFTRGGTVELEYGLVESADGSARLVFSVRDDGIGIDSARLADVMSLFVQEDGSWSRSHGGAGLGLPLSVKIVELLGGSLCLDSVKGAGTEVHVCIPVGRDAQ